jgi:ParB family chromosome partitioning protein
VSAAEQFTSRRVPHADCRPDPAQPRKAFTADALDSLATSLRERGQLQPILVRVDPEGKTPYLIVAGERRWRALGLIQSETVWVAPTEIAPDDVLAVQIVENLHRAAMTPLEEADAYQRILDKHGGDVVAAGKALGLRQSWRITERTCLLNLSPAYARLFATGNLSNAEAFHLAQLEPHGQDKLFAGIRKGLFPNRRALRAAQEALSEAQGQPSMFGDAAKPPAPEELAALSALEKLIDRVGKLLAGGFDQNRIVAAQRVNPDRAAVYADKLKLARQHLLQMENSLRAAAAVHGDLIKTAA